MAKNNPPVAPRQRMPISVRAKQFMPFSAVSGLELALEKKEWEIAEKQRLKNRVEKCPDDTP